MADTPDRAADFPINSTIPLVARANRRGAEKPFLSVVIPCYNEAAILEETVAILRGYLDGADWNANGEKSWEIIFVNDGSRDDSAALLARFAEHDSRIRSISYRNNGGQGKALQLGFAAARGEWVFCVDADLDYAPEHIERFLQTAIEREADIIVGSPFSAGGEMRGVPWVRRTMSRAMNWYFGKVLQLGIRTYTSIARLYRKSALDKLLLVSIDKDVLPEILIKANLLHLSVVEVPATLHWQKKRIQQRGKGLGIVSTTKKAFRHFLWGVIENPLLFFFVPGLVAACGTLWFGFAILWVFAKSYSSTDAGFWTNLTTTCSGVMHTAPQTCALFALFFHAALILSTIGLIVFQNKVRKEHEYVYLSRLMERLSSIEPAPAQSDESRRRVPFTAR